MTWKEKTKKVSGNQIIDSSITFDNLGCTIDEDNMASDSATHVPTQQSVKAYVDANGGGGSSQWTTSGSDIYYNTGNVGIGTNSPASKLHVSGDGDTASKITVERTGSTTGTNILGYNYIGTFANSELRLFTNSTEKMRIDSTGNVGIGTTNPSSKFVVSDSGGAGLEAIPQTANDRTTLLSYDRNTSTYQTLDLDASDIHLNISGTEKMRIDSSGNVGIGTTSPSHKLQVVDSVNGILDVSVNNQFDDDDETAPNPSTRLYLNAASNNGYLHVHGAPENSADLHKVDLGSTATGSFLTFSPDSTERMRIDTSGNVGIGTTSPAFDSGYSGLHISQTAPSIHLTPTSSGTTASDGYAINVNTSGIVRHINKENQPIEFHTNNTERLRIDSSGNVGIGVTDPSVELDVSGTIRATTRVNIGNSSEVTALSLYSGSAAAAGTFQSNATGAYIVFKDATAQNPTPVGIGAVGEECFIIAGGTEKLRIDDNGNVGIGTNDPAEKLDVQGNITATGVAKLDGGLATAPAYTFDGDTNTGMYSPAADTLAFAEGGAERMRINSAGKVLIGTTSQGSYGAKLRVLGGRIEASGYVATGNSSLFLLGGNYGAPTIECRSYTSYSSNTQKIMRFAGSTGTERGSITIAGVTTSYNTSSDERLKENISDAEDAGSKIDAIRIRQFDWKDGGEHQDYGVIAQELQSVAPEAVSEGYDEEDMWSVDYSKLVPTLIKEIQTLRNRVAQLENNE